MLEMGFTEYNEIEEYYSQRLIDIVLNLGAKIVTWQDPIDNNVTVNIYGYVGFFICTSMSCTVGKQRYIKATPSACMNYSIQPFR